MQLKRREAMLAALAAAAAARANQAHAASPDLGALYQAAKQEGQLTWSSGFLNQEICVSIGQAFSQKYPGISVEATKTTSQVAFQRLLQDLNAGQVQSDVFSSTDPSHMAYLQQKDLLLPFEAPSAAGLVPSLRDIEPKGYAYVGWVGVGAIGYNSKLVTEAESPKDWPDLTDPKWKNKLCFGSPIYSGIVGNWTVAMEQLYGWQYFDKLNALNPLIGRSFDDSVTKLNSGESTVGLVNIAAVARTVAKGNPLAVNYPPSGTLVVPSSSAVVKGCKHPNAGKLFLDFTCGPEYSKILVENFEFPLRSDVPPPKGAKSLADVKTLTPSLADIEKMLPGAKKKWKDTFS